MARAMLNQNALLKYFCDEAVNTACYVLNRVLIKPTSIKLSMSFKKIENPTLTILKFFNVNVSYWILKTILVNLIQNLMLVLFLDI